MSGYYANKNQRREKPSVGLNLDYRQKLCGLKRVIKDLVLENAYLCDEVAQVHEDILVLKEERRSLLKKLHQQEASAGIDSTLQPMCMSLATNECQSTSPAPKKAPKRKAPQETTEEINGNAPSLSAKQKVASKSKPVKEEPFDIDNTE